MMYFLLGLRKNDGRWKVLAEHESIAGVSESMMDFLDKTERWHEKFSEVKIVKEL